MTINSCARGIAALFGCNAMNRFNLTMRSIGGSVSVSSTSSFSSSGLAETTAGVRVGLLELFSFVIDSRADRGGRGEMVRATRGVAAGGSVGDEEASIAFGVSVGDATGLGDSVGDSAGVGDMDGVSEAVGAGVASAVASGVAV